MELVTGATGHAGNALVRELLSSGKKVRVLLRKQSDTLCLKSLEIEKVYGDITNLDSIMDTCRDIENVYHLAAQISIMPGRDNHLNRINLDGTQNIIQAAKKNKVKRLIYTSSIHALKEAPHGTIIDEQNTCFDPSNPRGAYDRSKAAASLKVLQACSDGLDTVVLCPTGFIGPYDYKTSLMGQFFIDYMQGRYKFIVNGAYDYVDVRDVAHAHILAAKQARPGHTYIISGHRVDMYQMTAALEKLTGIKPPKFWLKPGLANLASYLSTFYCLLSNSRPQFTCYSWSTINSNSYISSQKAQKELGYCPRPFEQSLKDTVTWYRELINPAPASP